MKKQKSAIEFHKELSQWYLKNHKPTTGKNRRQDSFFTTLAYQEPEFGKCGDINNAVDPLHELEWSDAIFDKAAHLDVAIKLLAWAKRSIEETGDTPSMLQLVNQLHKDVLQGAQNVSRSSSAPTNLVKQKVLEVKARYLDRFMYEVEFVEKK
jgi:hypothetical protein